MRIIVKWLGITREYIYIALSKGFTGFSPSACYYHGIKNRYLPKFALSCYVLLNIFLKFSRIRTLGCSYIDS